MAVEAFVDVYLPLLQLEAKSRHPIVASFSVWPAKPRKLLLFVISIRDFKASRIRQTTSVRFKVTIS